MVEPTFFPHRSDRASLLYSMLYPVFRTDGIAYQYNAQERALVHTVRHGKDIAVWRSYNTWRGRSEAVETIFPQVISYQELSPDSPE